MLAIETTVRELRELPVLTRVGLAVLLLGGLADLAAHVAVVGEVAGHEHGFTLAEGLAHLVAFAGMALVLVGVVVDGVRRTRPGRPAGHTSKGGT
ncbi:MAG TPA: hypothetical protein VGQ02_11605 [Candidatus Limnocylindrales bacterium]|jgi:hypothetical protein|nr:hypothetical protein [Candidatus Limnocylindrales bacterium]